VDPRDPIVDELLKALEFIVGIADLKTEFAAIIRPPRHKPAIESRVGICRIFRSTRRRHG
jgi:hypothetical protein